jgi:hypothetical protein
MREVEPTTALACPESVGSWMTIRYGTVAVQEVQVWTVRPTVVGSF